MSNKVTPESIEQLFKRKYYDENDDEITTKQKLIGFHLAVIPYLCEAIYMDDTTQIEHILGGK